MANSKTTDIFSTERALTRLRESVHAKAANFYAMYSSVLGGIVTDPALMVLPLDDHMVHRGHAVFDTATLTHGMLYQLDPHLDRLFKDGLISRKRKGLYGTTLQSRGYLKAIVAELEARGVRLPSE